MCSARRIQSAQSPAGEDASPTAVAERPSFGEHGGLRASDAEREAAAAELRVHAGTGRLDVEELDARLGAVLGARTRSEVAAVLSDLPAASPTARRAAATPSRAGNELHAYAAVMLMLLAIWVLSGAGHFWPIYPALGWGLPLLLGHGHARRRRLTAGP